MHAKILHICKDLYINSFGLMIVIGIFTSMWLIRRDPRRKKIITIDQLNNILFFGIISSVVGGRIILVLTDPNEIESTYQMLAFWRGGYSILGSVIANIIVFPIVLHFYKISIPKFFDLICTYMPLMQSISRIGCFLAGCCHGKTTNLPWAVTYNDQYSAAPLGISIHPTQLYSSIFLFCIFLFLYFANKHIFTKTGQITKWYLILMSIERFTIDFLRDDRVFPKNKMLDMFSNHQWMSILIIIFSIVGYKIYYLMINKKKHELL